MTNSIEIQDRLYHKVTEYTIGGNFMVPYKKYKDMTSEEQLDCYQWMQFYKTSNNIRHIIGANFQSLSLSRACTLTLADECAIDVFNTRIDHFRSTLSKIERAKCLFTSYTIIRALQPGTGRLHAHITFLNVDPTVSDNEYRNVLQGLWRGHVEFKRIESIYKWIQYLIDNIRPTDPQCIKERDVKKFSYGKNMKKATVTRYENQKPVFTEDSVVWEYRHKNSSSRTYLLKPTGTVEFIPDEDENNT